MSLEIIIKIFDHEGFVTQLGPSPFDLVAESERVFVAVKQFDQMDEMLDQWDTVQAQLASEFYGRDRLQEEKLWDTYLILVCPDLVNLEPQAATRVDDIHGNLAYCRKLLLDSAFLVDAERVRQKLSSLLSLRAFGQQQGFDPLVALRQKLISQGVPESMLVLVDETDLEQLIQRAKAGGQE